MNSSVASVPARTGEPTYLFFGGKGGVGKTTVATATAVWFADHGYRTTIISTDPTVSLSVVFDQEIGGENLVSIRRVPNLCGLNINPHDARGIFQIRLDSVMGQVSGTFGADITATPCAEEMATFDQFVGLLAEPTGDVVVFDTAPTGKTLRELAMPFDWAGFLASQIRDGKELAALMDLDEASFEALERDRLRYDDAIDVMRDAARARFTLVLLPERLPIEETASAIRGLDRLGIEPQALVVNQVIEHEVIDGNRFLEARSTLQARYLAEIDSRFADLGRARLPLLDRDVSDVDALRLIGRLLYGEGASKVSAETDVL